MTPMLSLRRVILFVSAVGVAVGGCTLDRAGVQPETTASGGNAATSTASGMGGDSTSSTTSGMGGAAGGSSTTTSAAGGSTTSGPGGAGGTPLPLGDPCSDPNACASGFCQDGVCCDEACDGECELCDNTTGMCGLDTQGFDDCPNPGELCSAAGTCTCGVTAAPNNTTCPSICNGGCVDGNDTCVIDCPGDTDCQDSIINCPSGYHCIVNCTGTNSCQSNNSTGAINCPEDYSCTVNCTGEHACEHGASFDINCSMTGPCSVSCNSRNNHTCSEATLNCGANECIATCGGSGSLPTINNTNNSCNPMSSNGC